LTIGVGSFRFFSTDGKPIFFSFGPRAAALHVPTRASVVEENQAGALYSLQVFRF
jgi:hypothetical protein